MTELNNPMLSKREKLNQFYWCTQNDKQQDGSSSSSWLFSSIIKHYQESQPRHVLKRGVTGASLAKVSSSE